MDWNRTPCSDELEKFIFRITIPSVVIDNGACPDSTVVTVDCARKDEILLEALQVLADLNLNINKANISSDGMWFMAVFRVTDVNGNKLADRRVLSNLEESLGTIHDTRVLGDEDLLIALELMGNDRVGLMSEVFAVLSELRCHVVGSRVWTHNGRIEVIIYVKDCNPRSQIMDSQRISAILARLRPVLKGDDDISSVKINLSIGAIHPERRLHQMMFADRDFERAPTHTVLKSDPAVVTVQNLKRWGYSFVSVKCKDRMKLSFDVVCMLTDMGYVVFHATANTKGNRAYLDFYTRHKDGTPINSKAEEERVIQCLKASISRRTSLGVRLELSTKDQPWLLADVTRTFRENGLNVTRAEISTSGNSAIHTFYVMDSEGFLPDNKTIDNVRERIGSSSLKVKELPLTHQQKAKEGASILGAILVSLGSIVSRIYLIRVGLGRILQQVVAKNGYLGKLYIHHRKVSECEDNIIRQMR